MPQTPVFSLRRSIGQKQMANALWYTAPGRIESRVETLPPVRDGFARVETHFSGISRGTESLVFAGAVPESEWQRMRAPMQQGEFPFPVKYGYAAAGRVVAGPSGIIGQGVFALHPHQDQFVVPIDSLAPVPDNIPLRRATLAANMETALNAIWDSGVGPGDRVCVVGAGIVGLLVAGLLARLPGTDVYITDIDPEKRVQAEMLGTKFCVPDDAPEGCDCVFHASATEAGLAVAIAAAGLEATVVEMSWYANKIVEIKLGGAFHSRRMRIVSSQVGHVAASHRPRWPHARRLSKALELLDDSRLDVLIGEQIAFENVRLELPRILASDFQGLPPVIRYANALS